MALVALPGAIPAARAQKGERPPPSYVQLGKPDQEEGRAVLEQFRRQGISGDYYLEFALRVLPRHGAERVGRGRLWGTRNADGPVSRVSLRPPGSGAPSETRLLIQSGPHPAVWRWNEANGGAVELLAVAAQLAPVADTDLTPFDLQMPFLYWPAFVYEGLARKLGRPAYQFLFYPPDAVAGQFPALTGVRAFLDTQYTALVEVALIGEGNRPLKTLSILDLKKIGDQWIVESLDLRDERTRDKTRFEVTAAALNQQFPAAVFDPAHLAEPAAAPSGADLAAINPP
ncbi:MAG TPA: outer membrane lipoprotein-sorting protein [Opitutaceae bacterium]|nr:outer membrane lipoprotein-sorting protein [Opitutaceae bacterium]